MYQAFGIALVVVLAGCQHSRTKKEPLILRISAIPDQPQAQVLQQHLPLVERICTAIQKTCQWVTADCCGVLVEPPAFAR